MRFALTTAAALAAAVLVGCKDEPKVTPTTTPTAEKVKDDLAKAGEKAKEGAEKALDKTKEVGEKALDKTKEAGEKALDKSKEVGGDIKDAVKNATDGSADKGLMAKAQEEATKLYDQAMEAVKKKDFTAADKALEGLEKVKGQLSPEWQSKVDSLKATIETAKKAGAVKIPGVND